MPLVGLLQFTLCLRGCAVFGCLLVSLATLASSLATSVGGLAALNTVFGVGIAFAYTCPLVCGYGWMPDRKGVVSGVIVAGFGAGAAVFNVVATGWVNPENASPDRATGLYSEEIAGRVPGMYLILGSCYLVLGMLGSRMLSPPPLASDFTQGSSDSPSAIHKTRRRFNNVRPSTGVYAHLHSDEYVRTGDELRLSLAENDDTKIYGLNDTPGTASEDNDIGQGCVIGVEDEGNSPADVTPSDRGENRTSSTSTYDIVNGTDVVSESELRSGGMSERQLGMRDLASTSVDISGDTGVDKGGGVAIGDGSVQDIGEGLLVRHSDETRPPLLPWKLLTSWDYFQIALSFVLTAVSGLFIAGNYKEIAQQRFPDDDRFLSMMGSFASLFNAAGRIVAGLAIDRFGCFATLLVIAVLTAGLFLIYNGAAQYSKPACFVVICLLHMLYGSNFAIYPTLTADIFGVSSAGPNYGLVFMAYGGVSFLVIILLARIKEVFLVCAGISLAGAVSILILWERQRRCNLRHPSISVSLM